MFPQFLTGLISGTSALGPPGSAGAGNEEETASATQRMKQSVGAGPTPSALRFLPALLAWFLQLNSTRPHLERFSGPSVLVGLSTADLTPPSKCNQPFSSCMKQNKRCKTARVNFDLVLSESCTQIDVINSWRSHQRENLFRPCS